MDSRGNKYTLDEDMNLFVKIIRNKLDGPYGTIGFSMGATTALSILDKYNDIKAAVLDSGPLIYVKDYFIYILTNKKIKNRLIRTIFTFMCLHRCV